MTKSKEDLLKDNFRKAENELSQYKYNQKLTCLLCKKSSALKSWVVGIPRSYNSSWEEWQTDKFPDYRVTCPKCKKTDRLLNLETWARKNELKNYELVHNNLDYVLERKYLYKD